MSDEDLHTCEICKLRYPTRELAEKCETWCREHKTCNIEVVKYAIGSYGTVSKDPLKLHISDELI